MALPSACRLMTTVPGGDARAAPRAIGGPLPMAPPVRPRCEKWGQPCGEMAEHIIVCFRQSCQRVAAFVALCSHAGKHERGHWLQCVSYATHTVCASTCFTSKLFFLQCTPPPRWNRSSRFKVCVHFQQIVHPSVPRIHQFQGHITTHLALLHSAGHTTTTNTVTITITTLRYCDYIKLHTLHRSQ